MTRNTFTIPASLSARSEKNALVTEGFQTVLDACRDAGGGRIVVPAGTYRVGSLLLHGDTELHLEKGACILGSEDIGDYTDWDIPTTLCYATDPDVIRIQGLCAHYVRALITVADAENVAITGEEGSQINGANCHDPNGEEGFRGAMGIRVCRCRNVTLRGYEFADSANWSHQIDSCDNVLIEDVTIRAGHDGFNVHHCNNVTIRGCQIMTGDDCVAGFDARNVVVEDCLLNTACNAIRLGCANLLVERCRFVGPGRYPHQLEGTHHMHSAVKYYSIKGDVIREDACNWRFLNCTFENVGRLINYDYGSEKGYQTERPLRDLHFENCSVAGVTQPSFFKGTPEVPGTLEFKNSTIAYGPDPANEGTPFMGLGKGATLIVDGVDYSGAGDAPFSGSRDACSRETIAVPLRRNIR